MEGTSQLRGRESGASVGAGGSGKGNENEKGQHASATGKGECSVGWGGRCWPGRSIRGALKREGGGRWEGRNVVSEVGSPRSLWHVPRHLNMHPLARNMVGAVKKEMEEKT